MPVQFYIGLTYQLLLKRMGANLKEGNVTTIGNVLKTVSHEYSINSCTNFDLLKDKLLKDKAENHDFPMIAIKHAVKKQLGSFETKLIKELPAKFPAALNLNEDFTQYGTNLWKNKPKGCAKRVQKNSTKWYGTYNCPFTDKYITVQPSFDTKEDTENVY